jgi:hypothetical protein
MIGFRNLVLKEAMLVNMWSWAKASSASITVYVGSQVATIIYIEQQSLEDEVMGFLELGFRTSNPKETPP